MLSQRHRKDRATRLVLILLCLLAFGPIMVVTLFRIVTIETRNGYRHLKYLVGIRAYVGSALAGNTREAGDRTTAIRVADRAGRT
jgi:hypothetical protein